jgi:hypothetical protein
MKPVVVAAGVLVLVGCAYTRHEFEQRMPQKVHEAVAEPPSKAGTIGNTHEPYTGKPKYLAEARPLLPTTSDEKGNQNPCARRSATCDERLRALLASIDGQILALSTPATDVQLAALRLDVAQVQPLLAPYSDITAERDELAGLVDKIGSMNEVDQGAAKKRMIELADLIRVQLAAAQ